MFAAMMLLAAGHVIASDGSSVVVQANGIAVGQVLTVQRLEHATGAPGRAPFFRWSQAGKARVTAVRADGRAEVAVVSGEALAGDRIAH